MSDAPVILVGVGSGLLIAGTLLFLAAPTIAKANAWFEDRLARFPMGELTARVILKCIAVAWIVAGLGTIVGSIVVALQH